MIVLDTNVISEPMRSRPDASVVEWLNGQPDTALFTTSVTVMELRFGVERLAEGKRKADLREVLDFTLSRLFGPRILHFDVPAATEAARIAAVAGAADTPNRAGRRPDRCDRPQPRLCHCNPRYGPVSERRTGRHQPMGSRISTVLSSTFVAC